MGYIASSIDRRPRGRSSSGTSIYGYIRKETTFFFYADSIYERILIVSFILGIYVVILLWMSP